MQTILKYLPENTTALSILLICVAICILAVRLLVALKAHRKAVETDPCKRLKPEDREELEDKLQEIEMFLLRLEEEAEHVDDLNDDCINLDAVIEFNDTLCEPGRPRPLEVSGSTSNSELIQRMRTKLWCEHQRLTRRLELETSS